MEDLKVKFPDEDILKILRFIAERKGVELSSYRRNFIDRHLRSRLVDTHAENYLDYISYMKENPGELDLFLDDLSINVTHFFRDKDVFDSFRQRIIPEFLGREAGGDKKLIRIWSAACASGQEPYSIAMLMSEALRGHEGCAVRIYATDVDNDALNKGRSGRYAADEVKDIPLPFLNKYFDREDGGAYVAKDELKALIRFDRHNLITDPPLKFLDVVFCRNVMIYFNREQQDALMTKFAQGLNSKGVLIIAKVESIWEKDLFIPVDHIRKIYRKVQ